MNAPAEIPGPAYLVDDVVLHGLQTETGDCPLVVDQQRQHPAEPGGVSDWYGSRLTGDFYALGQLLQRVREGEVMGGSGRLLQSPFQFPRNLGGVLVVDPDHRCVAPTR